jgi:hypothetical protein
VIVFVGEAPGGTSPAEAGDSWHRLARVLDTTADEIWARAVLTNLLARRPERDGKGDAFPLPAARRAATLALRSALLADARQVVLVGRRVSRAFGVSRAGYFVPFCLETVHAPRGDDRHPASVRREPVVQRSQASAPRAPRAQTVAQTGALTCSRRQW